MKLNGKMAINIERALDLSLTEKWRVIIVHFLCGICGAKDLYHVVFFPHISEPMFHATIISSSWRCPHHLCKLLDR